MRTIILCGGYGTRIRDVTADVPKPMVNIGRFPILWHIMKGYSKWGYTDFVLCLGYQSAVIKDFFVNYQMRISDLTVELGRQPQVKYLTVNNEEDWRITMADTGLNAMTGARIRRIRPYVEGARDFMLTYGDGVSNVDIAALVKFHQSHGKVLTVTGVRPPGRFGELEIDGDRVIGFNEKPQTSEGRISGGFFVCSARLFNYLDDRESLVFEVEPMRRLIEDDELRVFKHDGFWQPMDTSRDYKLLNELWDADNAPWKTW